MWWRDRTLFAGLRGMRKRARWGISRHVLNAEYGNFVLLDKVLGTVPKWRGKCGIGPVFRGRDK
jgi:hypothetical protein